MSLTGERIVIIRNPASSRASEVQRNVVDHFRDKARSPHQIAEFAIASKDRNETADAISEFMQPGDKVVIAGGDGTGNVAVNAYMREARDGVELGFLPYGNFNDMASTFTGVGVRRDPFMLVTDSETVDAYPLNVKKDGVHHRWAMLYATLGWTARVAEFFDQPSVRAEVKNRGAKFATSLAAVTKMYFQTRGSSMLPPFYRDDESEPRQVTDVLAVNGPVVARMIRFQRPYYQDKEFKSCDLNVSKLLTNTQFLGRSGINWALGTTFELPGTMVTSQNLQFESASVPLQLDGEFEQLAGLNQLTISKDQSPQAQPVKVMKLKR